MQIELTAKTEELIQSMLPEGGDPSTLIEAAVTELSRYGAGEPLPTCLDPATGQPMTLEELRAELAKGEADIKAGRVSRLDIDEIKKAARDRHAGLTSS